MIILVFVIQIKGSVPVVYTLTNILLKVPERSFVLFFRFSLMSGVHTQGHS